MDGSIAGAILRAEAPLIRVAIVDDHALVRAGLTAVLGGTDDIQVVGTFEDGKAFFHGLFRLDALDVVLLDVTMPESDGFDVLKRLRERRAPPRIVLLSMHPARTHARRAQQLGAHGYVTKDACDATVLEAVRTVAWGGLYFSDTGTEVLLQDEEPPYPEAEGLSSLSDQERRVLRLIYMGLTTKEISRDLEVSPKTVSTYKSRIMTKLGVGNLIELIRYMEAIGYGNG